MLSLDRLNSIVLYLRRGARNLAGLARRLFARANGITFHVPAYQLTTYAVLFLLSLGGFLLYRQYEGTEGEVRETQRELAALKQSAMDTITSQRILIDELTKTRKDLNSLQQSTTDAFSAERKTIDEQSKNLSRQGVALKKSEASAALLRKTLDDVAKAKAASPAPVNVSNALLSEIAPSVVKVYCAVDALSGSVKQGSGMLYHAFANRAQFGEYYVQTNLHVVSTDDTSPARCVIVVYPDYSNSARYLLFNSEAYKFYNSAFDIAFLTPQIVTNNAFAGTFSDLARYARDESKSPTCDSVSIGDHLSIFGYPAIGGETLTVTDGIVSGSESDFGTRYLKTSAKIDHGNSGGIAFKDSGCVAGIPTFVQRGQLESIARVLDLHYLFTVTLK